MITPFSLILVIVIIILSVFGIYLVRQRSTLNIEGPAASPKKEDPPNPSTSLRPSIHIHTKERAITCQLCLGRIKIGQSYMVCPCGMEYHRSCIEPTGQCPYCNRIYGRRVFTKKYNIPNDTNITLRRCPICGNFNPKETMICDCGAVFLDDEGSFSCPSCGEKVQAGQLNCPKCDDRFQEYRAVHCPRCHSLLPEGETVCECGLLIDNHCPDCGWELGRDDERCPICGLMFEFVRY
ncbi:MAG: hypothetical protein PWQ88_154 [Candidatus Methanomethylophilaceae archaeon]|nr:hypothetical protein [Candidatus Methanomethylophilaceae archaeon]